MKKLLAILCSLCSVSQLFAAAWNDSLPGNPVIRHKFTADPAALVHGGKVYLYAGHDEAPAGRDGYVMNEWLVFSSSDLVNRTEHPVPLKVKDFAWAKADAWAGQAIERNGKFYWYVTVEHGTIAGKRVCIDELKYNKDGSIKRVVMTSEGVQVK